jgi:hypothetical protein
MENSEAQYFVMSGEGPTPAALIMEAPDLPSAPWLDGSFLDEEIQEPLIYTLDPDYPGHLLALYDEEAVPLIREDLLAILVDAGIDNLQLFPAVIRDPGSGEEHNQYQAFNVVGVVSAADMSRSELMDTGDSTMVDVDFDRLYIDESRVEGALMFRLAEAVSAIVVHESVKRRIETAGIEGIAFYGPGEWAG